MKKTEYHPDWQDNRIKFILSKYSEDFFKGKRILELGAYNGYIGAYFNTLGAEVHCVEGRLQNTENIKRDYPNITVECFDLDMPDWKWGHYDIIINFGLYYHLENFHREHLQNCITNCDLMFFETVVYDSYESAIFLRNEVGDDQSLTDCGGSPTTSYVETIFKMYNSKYQIFNESRLNAHGHFYEWVDTGAGVYHPNQRRFWIVSK